MIPPTIDNQMTSHNNLPIMSPNINSQLKKVLQEPNSHMPLKHKLKWHQVQRQARMDQGKRKRIFFRSLYVCILMLISTSFLFHWELVFANPESLNLQNAPNPLHSRTTSVRFDRITVEDGLSQNAVLTIFQDHRGFIWMGTEDGLNKYNGYDFSIYKHDPEDPTTLADSLVSKIYEDQEGVLWLGTRSGLDRYNPSEDTFTHFQNDPSDPTSLSGTWVIAITEDREGTLWIGTDDGGLNRFNPETESFTHYTHDPDDPKSISDDSARVIYEDSRGNLWIGTRDGLNRFNRQSQTFYHHNNAPDDPFSLSGENISAILEDKQGTIWIATEGSGLYYFQESRNSLSQLQNNPLNPNSLSHDRVRALYEDQAGNLWVGTQNGLDQLDPNGYSFIHFLHDPGDPYSLSSNSIWSIYEDRTGGLWFGTYGGGVSKYTHSGNKFTLYQNRATDPNSLSDNMVWSIAKDQLGALWIGTFNGGLNRLDPSRNVFSHYRHDPVDPHSLSSDDVRAILQDSSGTLWIGTSGGLDRFDAQAGNFIHYRHDPENPNSLSENRVLVLLEDRSGYLWIGTRSAGLNRLDPNSGEFTRFQHNEDDETSLSDNRIWSLYEDRTGAIWVGTLGGLNLWEESTQKFIRYNHDPENPQSLSNDAIFSIYEDETGAIWIGTWGDGLERFNRDTQTFTHYTEKQGLPNNVIYGIEPDNEGNLWMSTNMGLSRFDPRTETFKNYDVRDGLQNNEFNVGAHFRASDGKLYFGGIQGFNSFYPDQVMDNPNIPPVVITTFATFNQTVQTDLPDGEEIHLSYKDNYISFEFAALDYSAPEKNLYAYKLEGFDRDWIEAGTRRYASYTNLKGGDYIFRVIGSNNDGVWNEVGTSILIRITPPIWETWWFIGIIAIAVLALTITGFRLRVRGIEARSTELENLVEERTHEIEHRTEELETLYRADEELYRHLELDRVLQTLVDLAIDILKADKSALFVWDEGQEKLVVRTARGFSPETLSQMTFTPGEGIIGIVAETGEPVIVEDTHLDPRVATRITEPEGIRSFMHFPIKIGEQVYGVFNADYAQPRGFGEDEQRLFSALAQRAASAIQNAQLYEAAQELAIVEERSRLARDLHDAVTQTLFSASLIAEVLPRIWEREPEEGAKRLAELRELTRGALAEMRTLLLELRPTALMEADLGELLRQLAESITGRARVPVRVRVQGECNPPPDVKVALYRIAQEALNNVAKHAAAKSATVSLSCEPNQLDLEISDDGQGFSHSALSTESLGLGIMRERAERIGAQIEIDSQVSQGTTIHVLWKTQTEEKSGNG
jgi:ligand-binding sensor domain-containing protein/signal transduction histidine kinase